MIKRETCDNCNHLHYVKSDDGCIDDSQICDIDGYFIIKTTHTCRQWRARQENEANIHLLDSRHLDSRELMVYKNGIGKHPS